MNNLTIANISIRVDAEGRYCINDLHRAAGKEKRQGASYWLNNQQTKALIAELQTTVNPVVTLEGRNGGTYACKELVYAYAMWISPAFHLKVIRAYDAMISPALVNTPATEEQNLAAQYKAAIPVAAAVVELGAALGWTIEKSQAAAVDVIQRKMGVDIGEPINRDPTAATSNPPASPVVPDAPLSCEAMLEHVRRAYQMLFRSDLALARAAGMVQSTTGRILRGDVKSPTLSSVDRLYRAVRAREAEVRPRRHAIKHLGQASLL